ncbi:MAG TPA: 4'-phosphopantetheinyl transferase superfamily protein [Sandaracinaceae bacterium LLY-WYZ-13_1]|nr:4'-phosphopantetheinyl transferase superfamily protein [Sandaracinaceae bacterium LLY-WYZ-13_1]
MPLRAEEVEGLLDPAVIVLTSPVDAAAEAELGPRERAALTRAGGKRRREYATARWLARRALARLGVAGFELLNDDDRAPRWPPGVAGSITHSDRRAVVAVGRLERVGTFGVDVEHRAGLAERLWRPTLRAEEQRFLATRPPAERERWALFLFSAKEALYKAQYPVSREYMGFSALRVALEPEPDAPLSSGSMRCVFQRAVGPFPEGFVARGRYRTLDGEVLTAVEIPSRQP